MRNADFSAYGLSVEPTFDLPVPSEEPAEPRRLTLRLGGPGEMARLWRDGYGVTEWQSLFAGDLHVRWQRGREDDHLVTYGRRATFHLDAAGGALTCFPVEPDDLDWQRFLLETVLSCASSVIGFEALHAAAVDTAAGVVVLVAPRGGGKSTVAAELIGRGHALFSDDVLALSRGADGIVAHPGPPLMTVAVDAAAEVVGEQLGDPHHGSAWVRVERAVEATRPVAAVFLLERERGAAPESLGGGAPGRLLPHCLSLGRDGARALSLVGMLRELADQAPVYRVGLPQDGVREAADAIEAALAPAARPYRGLVDSDHVAAA